jgi:hypothetical protein
MITDTRSFSESESEPKENFFSESELESESEKRLFPESELESESKNLTLQDPSCLSSDLENNLFQIIRNRLNVTTRIVQSHKRSSM